MLQMLLQGQYLNRRTISEKFHGQGISEKRKYFRT